VKHFITWHAFDGYVQELAQHIKQSMDTDLHDIVGVSRGGLVLAAALSYALNIKNVHSVGIRSYTTNNDQQDIQVYQHLNLGDLRHHVLVVDDVSDTGNTFLHLQKLLINKQVTTASWPQSATPSWYQTTVHCSWIPVFGLYFLGINS